MTLMTTRRLTLTEFKTQIAVPLSVTERDALRKLHKGLLIQPAIQQTDRYDITPDQHIGLIALPSLTVEIRPKIPMNSVLFMVSYACDVMRWDSSEVDYDDHLEFVELLAIIFARAVERATHRGLLHGYRTAEELAQAPRGRILFDQIVRGSRGRVPPVPIRHDDFTHDILENRLLLAALAALQRAPLRSQATRREIRRAQRAFGSVESKYFPAWNVPDVAITRLNRHYQPALALARIILESTSVDLGSGGARGSSFLIDMNRVFELFVRKALRWALGVDEPTFPDRPAGLYLDAGRRILLKPDLCLRRGDHMRWVGDVKYKRVATDSHHNADLYQLLAYTIAMDLPSGMLIYAADEGPVSVAYTIKTAGKSLKLRAIDPSMPKRKLLNEIQLIALEIEAQSHAVHAK
jgi:5-methylcytosine-specific restriction enzyme subunit McrC